MTKFQIFVTILVTVFLTNNVQIAFAQPPDSIVVWSIPLIPETYVSQFTHDDRFIVTAGYSICIIETATGKVLRSIKASSTRRMIKISDDDSLIYTVGDDSLIYAYRIADLSINKIYTQMDNVFKHYNFFDTSSSSISFDISRDNKFIAFNWANVATDGIGIYDLVKDTIIFHDQSKESEGQPFGPVRFFQNDNKLAIAYSNTIRIYDKKTFKVERIIGNASRGIADFDISPDEKKIVTAVNFSYDEGLIWDLNNGSKIFQISSFCQNPRFYDNNYLWTESNGPIGICIWNLATKQISQSFPVSFGVYMAWSNDRKYTFIAAGPDPGYFYLINNDKVLSVTDIKEKKLKELHPNPVTNIINFDYEQKNNSELDYKISNISGQIILQGDLGFFAAGTQLLTINVSSLTDGIYFLSIISNKDAETYKIVKGR